MPFLDEEMLPGGAVPEPSMRAPFGVPDKAPESPSGFDVVKASLVDNPIASAAEWIASKKVFPDDPTHNPLDVIGGTEFEQNWLGNFIGSRSEEETRSIMGRIQNDQDRRRTLDAAGIWGDIASTASSLASPTTLLPGGAAIKGASRVGSIGRTALGVGLAGAAGAAIDESVFQGTSETRTAADSAMSIAGSAILAGILGGAVGSLAPREAAALSRDIETGAMTMRPAGRGLGEPAPTVNVPLADADAVRPISNIDETSGMVTSLQGSPDALDAMPSDFQNYVRNNRLAAVEHRGKIYVAFDHSDAVDKILDEYGPAYEPTLDRSLKETDFGVINQNGQFDRMRPDTPGFGGRTKDIAQGSEVMPPTEDASGRAVGRSEWDDYFDPPDPGQSFSDYARHYELTPDHPDYKEFVGWWKRNGYEGAPADHLRAGADDAEIVPATPVGGGMASSAGAAAARSGDNRLASALGVENVVRFQDPMLRLQTSPLVAARHAVEDLAETPLRLEKNAQGVATAPGGSVETQVKLAQAQLAKFITTLDDAFSRYRFGREKKAGDAMRAEVMRVAGQGEGYMTYREFKEAVTNAARNGDEHPVPAVAEAARSVRSLVFDPQKNAAIDAGIFGEGVGPTTAESYVPRIWNKEIIRAKRPDVVSRFLEWLQADQTEKARIKDRLTTLSEERAGFDKAIAKVEKRLETLDRQARQTGARLAERSMEVRRTGNRVNALNERAGLLAERISDIEEFIGEVRGEASDPSVKARIAELQSELKELRAADKPVTEADLKRAEDDEVRGILTGTMGDAAAMLTGRRKWYKPPSFLSWITKSGGVTDTGGDIRQALGDLRARPGLVRKVGRDPDDLGEAIVEMSEGRVTERPDRNQIIDWISDAARGRDPDWWQAEHIDHDKAAAAEMAAALDEMFKRAGIEVKSSRDVALALREGRRADGSEVSLEDLDRAAAEMEGEYGENIPVRWRRIDAENELAVRRETIRELRAMVTQALVDRHTTERALGRADLRSGEAKVGERANVGRLGLLQGRIDANQAQRETLETVRDALAKSRDASRETIEDMLNQWQGKSAKPAKSALVSRQKYADSRERPEGAPRLKGADRAVDDAVRSILNSDRDLSRVELEDKAQRIVDRILGSPDGRLPYDLHNDVEVGPSSGREQLGSMFQPRDFAIPDNAVSDLLENDIEHLARMTTHTMATDIALVKKFGDVRLLEAQMKIREEANARIQAAETPAERVKIDKQADEAIRDLAGIRDRMRGVYGIPSDPGSLMVRAGRLARSLNHVRLLGGSTLSSLPDIGRPVMQYGLTSVFRDGFLPYINGFQEMKARMIPELRAASVGLDMELDSRAMSMADIADDYGKGSKFERAVHSMSSRFGLTSLLGVWTAGAKTITGTVGLNAILRATEASAAGRATQKQITNLARSGIDPAMAQRIWREFTSEGGGDTVQGVLLSNTEAWKDKGAIDALRGALVRDVDRLIVTPGQDRPLWMSKEWGKIIGQFKGYSIASTQRILLAGLQERDAATLNGVMAMMALGTMSYAVKQSIRGEDLSDNPAKWAIEAFDYSGLGGWLMEVNGAAEKISGGHFGLSVLTGEYASRFASRNTSGAFLGPTVDLANDLLNAGGAVLARDWKQSDTHALRKVAPYNNIFYLRWLFDAVEHGANDALGVPAPQRRSN